MPNGCGRGDALNDTYEIRPFDHSEAELGQVAAFLRGVFPRARHLTPAYLRWLYTQNPEGRALGYNAFVDGEMVGHSSAQPLTAMVEGREERGAILLNTANHWAHRRRGLSKLTTEPMFADAAADGRTFFLAVANMTSTPPLLTQFSLIGPLDARLGLGRPRRRAVQAPPSFERLWSEAGLRWRLANPERHYGVQASAGRVSVVAPSGWPGIDAILFDGENQWDLPAQASGRRGRLRAWIGLDPQIDWSRSLYLPIPRRLRPSPLNLTFLDLTRQGVRPDPARFVFRAIDFDPF